MYKKYNGMFKLVGDYTHICAACACFKLHSSLNCNTLCERMAEKGKKERQTLCTHPLPPPDPGKPNQDEEE